MTANGQNASTAAPATEPASARSDALGRNRREDFGGLVDRLAVLSGRPKDRWEDRLATHARDLDGPAWFTGLAAWDPLAGLPRYTSSKPSARCWLAKERVRSFYIVGIDLETILRRGLIHIAASLPASHPAHRYIGYELAEEAEHSAMFEWFVTVAMPGGARHSSISPSEIERISNLGRDNPAAFLLYVVCGELMFDRVQRAALAAGDTHPLVAEIDRIHCVEEARHLSFGRAMLKEMLATADQKLIRRLTYEAPVVARWTSERVINVPRSLLAAFGASDQEMDESRELTEASVLYRRCINDLHRFCRSVGLYDDRLRGRWGLPTEAAGSL